MTTPDLPRPATAAIEERTPGGRWETYAMPEMPWAAKALVTSPPYTAFARRVLLPWMQQGYRPSGDGLEIGAGSGVMTAQLLSGFPGLRMVTTDYDPDMVASAQRALARFDDRASVEWADAAALPFEAGRFDFVLSAAMLHHVVAWERAVAEAARVLRPGGRLIGYDLLDTALVRALHFNEHENTRMLRKGQLEAELDRAGFAGVRVRPAMRGQFVRFAATKAA